MMLDLDMKTLQLYKFTPEVGGFRNPNYSNCLYLATCRSPDFMEWKKRLDRLKVSYCVAVGKLDPERMVKWGRRGVHAETIYGLFCHNFH